MVGNPIESDFNLLDCKNKEFVFDKKNVKLVTNPKHT